MLPHGPCGLTECRHVDCIQQNLALGITSSRAPWEPENAQYGAREGTDKDLKCAKFAIS
jgi:hypothetical protein